MVSKIKYIKLPNLLWARLTGISHQCRNELPWIQVEACWCPCIYCLVWVQHNQWWCKFVLHTEGSDPFNKTILFISSNPLINYVLFITNQFTWCHQRNKDTKHGGSTYILSVFLWNLNHLTFLFLRLWDEPTYFRYMLHYSLECSGCPCWKQNPHHNCYYSHIRWQKVTIL